MKQKVLIGAGVLLLAIVILLMVQDASKKPDTSQTNPFEYNLDKYNEIDSSVYCYEEALRFKPDIQALKGIAIDNKDNVYLTGLQKVMIYDKNLNFLKGFKINAAANAIAVSDKGLIFLGVDDHIEIFDKQGNKLNTWEPFNKKSLITSIALDESAVYLADAANKVVLEYNYSGDFVKEIGKKDTLSDRPGFIIPSPYFDVFIGREDQLWAVNSGLHTLEAYNSEGQLISSWKRTSMQLDGFSGCCNPSHVAMLSDGSFVTSEKGIVRVKIHKQNGDFKCIIAGPASFEEGTTGIDLAVNSDDHIFLIVPHSNEVRKYIKKYLPVGYKIHSSKA